MARSSTIDLTRVLQPVVHVPDKCSSNLENCWIFSNKSGHGLHTGSVFVWSLPVSSSVRPLVTQGHCKLSPTCQVTEDTNHILRTCSALRQTRDKLMNFTETYCTCQPVVGTLVRTYCKTECRLFCQFLLDCSVLPDVIAAVQMHGEVVLTHLFNISR